MIAQQGCWADLAAGGYMRDKNGKVWRVESVADGAPTIVDRQGETHTLAARDFTSPVTLMVLDEAEQLQLLVTELGAEIYAERHRSVEHGFSERGDVWLCPAFPTSGEEAAKDRALTHLKFVHRIYVEPSRQLSTLTQVHDKSHEEMIYRGYREADRLSPTDPVPHVHTSTPGWVNEILKGEA